MTLLDVVRALNSFDKESTIYAVEPWSENAKAEVILNSSLNEHADLNKLGMTYLIEVFLAQEFMEGWLASLAAKPTLDEQCRRLVEYATNDA